MVSAISTDTRKITKDSVFVALKGERFDGHDFAAEAMKLGAAAVIAERPVEGAKCIIVDSSAKLCWILLTFTAGSSIYRLSALPEALEKLPLRI